DVQPRLLPPVLPLRFPGGYAERLRRAVGTGQERHGQGPRLRGGVCVPQPEQEPDQAPSLGGRRLRGVLQEARKGHLCPPVTRRGLPFDAPAGAGLDGRGHTGAKIQAEAAVFHTRKMTFMSARGRVFRLLCAPASPKGRFAPQSKKIRVFSKLSTVCCGKIIHGKKAKEPYF